MIDQPSAAVQAIIHDALATTRPTHLLAEAARRTTKGGGWKGRLKLSRDEALAATRVVTELVRRYDLKPTKVLQRDGRASTREQTYPFFLTDAEMASGSVVARQRLAKGIAAHVDNVRAIAAAARAEGHEIDEDSMMAELAEAVASFLDQFRDEAAQEPDAELADDVAQIANWLCKPNRRFELARCLAGADRLDLDYDDRTGTMSHVGPDVSPYAYGIMPWVPIRTRPVAEADCIVHRRDDAESAEEAKARDEGSFLFFASPKLDEIGRERAVICEKVGLGVSLDRGKTLRMSFTLDHVVYAGTSFGENRASDRERLPGHLECRGIPKPGRPEMATDDVHYVEITSPVQCWCSDFRAYVTDAFKNDGPFGDEEASYSRRFLPVTADTCRLLLDGGDRDALFAWRHFADVKEHSVLPRSALTEEGIESWLVRDRFLELLYDQGERGLVRLLEIEVMKRTEAYDLFLLNSMSGARRRKLDFRTRMRG